MTMLDVNPEDAPQPVTVVTRRGTTAQWLNTGLILAPGESGRDITTGEFKYGDGVHTFAELPVAYASFAQIEAALAAMGAGDVDLSDDDAPDLTVLAEAAAT